MSSHGRTRGRRGAIAVGLSVAIHAGAVGLVGWRVVHERAAALAGAEEGPVTVLEAPAVEGLRVVVESPSPFPAVAGDFTRQSRAWSAPTSAPNPDPHAGRASASSGSGPGVRDLTITGRRDDETLRAQ